ncbi:hypothetical protein CYMTET_10985 [Cymbomonas tetramitiformis]|uniref:Endonuclease/exonuclease/phosphatase domain-containing protein n=1 Tax=Cymbomonas tetramitiformis TaxID=36881 RepID=A0AAE0LDX3_9CHLO|nr:hypothetical protein CYMTET_10985 [Cymbomonas tetramitiformis]|eukprot:gene11414-13488_t
MAKGLSVRIPEAHIAQKLLETIPEKQYAAAENTLKSRRKDVVLAVTWNVWFDNLWQDERLVALVSELLQTAPDVCGLQEVTARFLEALQVPQLMNLYQVYPKSVDNYGCAILVRSDWAARFREVPLPTMMGRSLIIAQAGGLTFATVHLESLASAPVRRKQLAVAAKELASSRAAVLCGDFNFDCTRNWGEWKQHYRAPSSKLPHENESLADLLPSFIDCWPHLHSADPGYTFDGVTNGQCINDELEQMRYDRFLANQGFEPTAIHMLGTAEVALPSGGTTKPSDHYGLAVHLKLKPQAEIGFIEMTATTLRRLFSGRQQQNR